MTYFDGCLSHSSLERLKVCCKSVVSRSTTHALRYIHVFENGSNTSSKEGKDETYLRGPREKETCCKSFNFWCLFCHLQKYIGFSTGHFSLRNFLIHPSAWWPRHSFVYTTRQSDPHSFCGAMGKTQSDFQTVRLHAAQSIARFIGWLMTQTDKKHLCWFELP